MRTRSIVAALALVLAWSAAHSARAADPAPVSASSDKVKVKLYGQVNRALLFVDDSDETNTYFVDNDASSTRIGLTATSLMEGEWTVGSKIEVQIESNTSASVNREEQDTGAVNFTQRHLDLYVKHARFGKLSLGHGDTASNGAAEVDLSGTALAGYSDIPTFAGGQLFWDEDADALSGTEIGDVFDNMDGNSRRDRLRYDTPEVYGFILSASAIESDRSDIALSYGGDFPGARVEAVLAWAYEGTSNRSSVTVASASVLLDFGLSVTVAAGQREENRSGVEDASYYYGKIGYQRQFFPIGITAFSVDFGAFDDVGADEDDATVFGWQFVQKLADYGTELYAGYRHHDLDREGADLEAIDGLLVGGRVKF